MFINTLFDSLSIYRVTVKTFRNDQPYPGNLFEKFPELVDLYPSFDDVEKKTTELKCKAEKENKFYLLAVHEKGIEEFIIDEFFNLHDIIVEKRNFRKDWEKKFLKL
jgi:hypothetical protein